MRKKHILKELLSFIRIENGLFTGGIAVSGYLVFNRLDLIVLPLLMAMFLGTSASYAYNYLKDRKEDLVNKKRLNRFVLEERQGKVIVVSFFFLGVVLSLSFYFFSFMTYLFLIMISVLYSGLIRIKERFLAKNFNTGLGISLSFMVGAMANGFFDFAMLAYAGIVFMLGFSANVLGDMRGLEGDRSIGMLTLPMFLGPEKTKLLIYSIISFLSLSVFLLDCLAFYPLIPFMIISIFLLAKGRMRGVRVSMLSSFAVLPVLLIMFNLIGGV